MGRRVWDLNVREETRKDTNFRCSRFVSFVSFVDSYGVKLTVWETHVPPRASAEHRVIAALRLWPAGL